MLFSEFIVVLSRSQSSKSEVNSVCGDDWKGGLTKDWMDDSLGRNVPHFELDPLVY